MYTVVLRGEKIADLVIRADDTIDTIKKKIWTRINLENEVASYEELYLFAHKSPEMAIPLGQAAYAEYPVDPMRITEDVGDDVLEGIYTRNQSILLEYGELIDRTIHVVLAEDVLARAQANEGLAEQVILRLYFPHLKIESAEELLTKRSALIHQNREDMGDRFERNVANINQFYEFGGEYQEKLNDGISFFDVLLHPQKEFNLPLEMVFKLIHATKESPMSKYNPGGRFEKVFRLHTNGIATNRKKIPSLSKGTIFRLANTIGKRTSVAVAVNLGGTFITCRFEKNGDVGVSAEMMKPLSVDEVSTMIRESVQPVINVVGEYLAKSGYQYIVFGSLNDANVEIINMTYHATITDTPMPPLTGCVASAFNVISAEEGVLRFKRISNYNEMDSEESFLTEQFNRGVPTKDIVTALQMNFSLSEEAALARYTEFHRSRQDIQDTYHIDRVKAKYNPGFHTSLIEQNGSLQFKVTDVNHLGFLQTMPIYFYALTQMPQTKCDEPTITENVMEDVEATDDVEVAQEIQFENKNDEDLLNILGDSDSEEEESSEEEEEEEDLEGGAGKNTIKGMSGVFFREKLEKHEPDVWNERKTCPSSAQRVPIALTDEELAKIDEKHPGSYSESVEDKNKIIRYGTSEDKKRWYICPRYWSINQNTSLNKEDVASGNYGDVYSKDINSKEMPANTGVWEFRTKESQGTYPTKYAYHYPGLAPQKDANGNPTGKFIPCCVKGKTWTGDKNQANMRNDPNLQTREDYESSEVEPPPVKEQFASTKKEEEEEPNEYIHSFDRFPLPLNRFGHIPKAIQNFFQVDNQQCQISKTDTNVRDDCPCFVRRGVEYKRDQSFIACLTDLLRRENNDDTFTLEETKTVLSQALTPAVFARLHDGDFVQAFETHENFVSFLMDDDVEINHVYLWDFICRPNIIFKRGINLIILELNEENNMRVLCPTNAYASVRFHVDMDTVFMVKKGDKYEPIYLYNRASSGAVKLTHRFNKTTIESFKNVLDTIESIIQSKCKPLPSQPKNFTFIRNDGVERLIETLHNERYKVQSQVINQQDKVVGLVVDDIFVPCYPSASSEQIPNKIQMSEVVRQKYEPTRDFLVRLHQENGLKTNPTQKIVEDDKTVGILTETNQFVPVVPSGVISDELTTTIGTDHFEVDMLPRDEVDTERVEYVENIYLEEKLFALFRNRIRALMKDQKNFQQTVIIIGTDGTYENKLGSLDALLRDIVGNHVIFEKNNKLVHALAQKNQIACANDDKCELIVAKKNLVNNGDNESLYFGRIADELLRYNHLRKYIMDPDAYLQLEDIGYNLNDDEIILLESEMTQEYFTNIIQMKANKYMRNSTYNMTQPIIGQVYKMDMAIEPVDGNETKEAMPADDGADPADDGATPADDVATPADDVATPADDVAGKPLCEINEGNITTPAFGKDIKIWRYANDPAPCSFNLILHLIPGKMEVNVLKEELLSEYKKHNKETLMKIFASEKRKYAQNKTIDHIIMDEGYVFTLIDAFVCCLMYDISALFIWKTHKRSYIVNESDEPNAIILTGTKKAKFGLLVNADKRSTFSVPEEYTDSIRIHDISTYIDTYEKPLVTLNM